MTINNKLSTVAASSVANSQMKNQHEVSAALVQGMQRLTNSFYEIMTPFISQGQVRPGM
jgi:hypothetical protein